MSDLIIQAIGFIGAVFFIVSYQIRSNRALFLFQLIGCLIFTAQFLIIGAYTGGAQSDRKHPEKPASSVCRYHKYRILDEQCAEDKAVTDVRLPCTLVYDALIHSWGGAMNEAIALISIIVSVCRFGWSNLAKTEA